MDYLLNPKLWRISRTFKAEKSLQNSRSTYTDGLTFKSLPPSGQIVVNVLFLAWLCKSTKF